jgi:hypothetical protein
MWWCAGVAGDYIAYAEASSLDGPWHAHGSSVGGTFDLVFSPTGNTADFDGTHVCDPSVVRVDGVYYMYYGGYPATTFPSPDGMATTRIGVARSVDGRSWTRLNGGRPILSPARDPRSVPNAYGAGQPAVTHVDGWFYLTYTDTTGLGTNPINGAGQFVLRSRDPEFQDGVETFDGRLFVPRSAGNATRFSLVEAFSVDWMFSDVLSAFVLFRSAEDGQMAIDLYRESDLSRIASLRVPASWRDGPGLVRRPDGHAPPDTSCGSIPIDAVRAIGTSDPTTWNLARVGTSLATGNGCECETPSVLEGLLVGAPGRPLTLVRGGSRLQFASGEVATHFGRSYLPLVAARFDTIPYAASVVTGADVVGAPGRPAAFLLDDGRLWPVSCSAPIVANGSSIRTISTTAFDAFPVAQSLFCLNR